MRFKDLILAAIVVAVIVIAGALLVLNSGGDDDKDNLKSTQGAGITSSSAATAPTLPAPAASSPSAQAPAATQAPASQPAGASGEPSCTGPTLASLKRGTTKSWPKAPDRVIDPAKTYTALIKT